MRDRTPRELDSGAALRYVFSGAGAAGHIVVYSLTPIDNANVVPAFEYL